MCSTLPSLPSADTGRANPAGQGSEPASGNPPDVRPLAGPPGAECDGKGAVGASSMGHYDNSSVQRMQLEMLQRENAELGSKLETLTQQLRSSSELAGIDHNIDAEIVQQAVSLDRELCAVPAPASKKQKRAPKVKEVLLVFEGDLQNCCRETISAKLLHLKRLLHRRLEASLSPTPDAMSSLLHVLLAAKSISPPGPQERLRVQASMPLHEDAQDALRGQILSVVAFTVGAKLPCEAVTFVELCPEAESFQRSLCPHVISRPAHVQVVVTAFNNGTHDEIRIQDSVLTEICEPESSGGSVAWAQFMGKYVNVGYVNKDMARLGQDERTVVCSSSPDAGRGKSSISLYYPSHLEPFFSDRALRDTLQPGARERG
jgi:hypothetical protein